MPTHLTLLKTTRGKKFNIFNILIIYIYFFVVKLTLIHGGEGETNQLPSFGNEIIA